MTDYIPQENLFTGRKMLLIIVAFFGVIIAVNGTMLTVAVKTFGGLVVGNSYVASQNFNEDIAAAKAQPIRGWGINLAAETGLISLSLRDVDGTALEGIDISLKVARPSHERSTFTIPLNETQAGIYTGEAEFEPGRWVGTISTGNGQVRSYPFNHAKPAS